YSAQLVGITNALGDPPFGLLHHLSALSFSIFAFYIIGLSTVELSVRFRLFGYSPNALGDPQAFFSSSFQPFCSFCQVVSIKLKFGSSKRDVSNSATQDSIMKHKIQFNHAKIKCALKVSSFVTPLSKNLKLTILLSNASSSSTKVFKCPHAKNDSIFTQRFTIQSFIIKCNANTHKDEYNA
ncbi:hypothetical protein H5410_051146, partial [Solanum commersonii]